VKRFWQDVAVDARAIRLDGRPVRTPGRAALTLPTDGLAEAVADEWRAVGETVDPRAMPLTGLANAAIDRIAADPAGFAAGLAKYGESDLLCYRAAEPPELAARQAATA
jgi:chaperone required for assembly of F1-ATPase